MTFKRLKENYQKLKMIKMIKMNFNKRYYVYEMICLRPGSKATELARITTMPLKTIRKAIKELIKNGLVRVKREIVSDLNTYYQMDSSLKCPKCNSENVYLDEYGYLICSDCLYEE